ncbi:GNAT family N-acetyltransferase [Streptomyces sp. STR69]|uniref:GNAT family N-acetyltransferase n=1 Tax=Streptomyces sp. STR69 TaxID=1796942 RepID=UPI0021C6B5D8|nr:GNAT family protein [Streptomyces sp. STR69]
MSLSASALPLRTIGADGLLLRPLTEADEPAVAEALRDADILRWAAGRSVTGAAPRDRARAWLTPRLSCWESGAAVFAVADPAGDTLLGSIGIREINRLPDQAVVTYWVTPAARGRHLAARALDTAARWAFAPAADGGLGLHRLTLDHAVLNTGSCRVAAGAGFRLEGTMRDHYIDTGGTRHDFHLHARLAGDTREDGGPAPAAAP